jgi:hypothetical protein
MFFPTLQIICYSHTVRLEYHKTIIFLCAKAAIVKYYKNCLHVFNDISKIHFFKYLINVGAALYLSHLINKKMDEAENVCVDSSQPGNIGWKPHRRPRRNATKERRGY